jgi:hypothetical protein
MYNDKLGWAMPFGSMCNSYGQVNQGTHPPMREFLEDMRKIKELAVELTEDKKGVPAQDIEL